MSERHVGQGADAGILLARRLRERLDIDLRRADVTRRWERENPGRRCVVAGEGTPGAPFITVGFEQGVTLTEGRLCAL